MQRKEKAAAKVAKVKDDMDKSARDILKSQGRLQDKVNNIAQH